MSIPNVTKRNVIQRNKFFFEKLMHDFTVNAIKAMKASKPNIPALPKIEKKNE